MSSARWAKKNWDAIAAELSSGEDSDAGDSLNVLAVQRNAHRVAELLHGAVPGLDEGEMRALPRGAAPPGRRLLDSPFRFLASRRPTPCRRAR